MFLSVHILLFFLIVYPFQNKKFEKLLVAAIDFGTTYSGYAFITKDDYEKCMGDNSKIHCPTWAAPGGRTYKAPTTVLFQPDKTFHSFGYEAEKFYHENSENIDFKEWYYFKHFKMKLYTDKVNSLPSYSDKYTRPNIIRRNLRLSRNL